MTIFEPPTSGQLISGLGFHEFFFVNEPPYKARRQEILNPVVHYLGDDGAVISYVRIIQAADTYVNASSIYIVYATVFHPFA